MSDLPTRPVTFVDVVDETTDEDELALDQLAIERAIRVDQRLNLNQIRSLAWQRRMAAQVESPLGHAVRAS
jgi:hypothetical protein